ncbi:MAG: RNA polymerase sigma factor [Hyphomonadaceae bacterium]
MHKGARVQLEDQGLVGLYLERRPALYRFFLARTGSATEAEDALQDLYLHVRNAKVGPIADGLAYLYRLGLNLLTDRHRRRVRRRRREDAYSGAHFEFEGGDALADAPSPEAAAEARLRLEQLLAAIDALPPQQRRVFRMHRVEGMSHREISDALGVSRSAVEKHMIAALRHLAAWER